MPKNQVPDNHRFESATGNKLKLPEVANLSERVCSDFTAFLTVPPTHEEAHEAKTRMRNYYHQSRTIPNPNSLSEMLRKEFTSGSFRMRDKLPKKEDFPIYVFHRLLGKFERFNSIEIFELLVFRTDPEIFWCSMIQGD
jgi:hypothetical protein